MIKEKYEKINEKLYKGQSFIEYAAGLVAVHYIESKRKIARNDCWRCRDVDGLAGDEALWT